MNLDKAVRVFELLDVHPITECSHRITLDTFQSRAQQALQYEYEYEEALTTLRVEFIIRETNQIFEIDTSKTNEEGVIDELLDILPDGFSKHDLPVYLVKLQKKMEEN